MKICIDLTSLADNFSGVERYAACLSIELIHHHHEEYVLIFKNEIHSLFKEISLAKNIQCVVLSGKNKLFFNQIILPWAIHKIKADYYLFLAFPVPVLSFKKNMLSTIHDICCWDCPKTMNGMSKWYFRFSHKAAIKKCKAILTISEFSKKRIHEKLHYPEDKIWLIYCGIDMARFNVHPECAAAVKEKYCLPDQYILSLSTLEPRKNLSLLINAYVQLMNEGIKLPKLVLAGRKGWKMDDFLSTIDTKIKDRIIFTGFIEDEDLPDVYGNAKLFIFPSMYEGFGMPPLEAMACGAFVLSSDAASLPEILGDAAVYFKSQNVDSLKEVLKKLNLMTESQFLPYKEKAEQQCRVFSWTKEANKLWNYLK